MGINRRWHIATGIALLLGGVAVIPGHFISEARAADDTIKIGWVGPLSPPGGYAEGALMKQAAQLAADQINAKGGLLGKKIEMFYEDTRGQPEEGTAAAERLISQDHVIAITGEFHSSVFLAEMEVAHKAGIPLIAVDVWANKITAKAYPEVFRVAPCQALIATKYGDWIAAAGFKNVAVLYEKTDGGQSARDVIVPILDQHHVKHDEIGADPNSTEFTAQIERLKSHTPPYDFFMTEFSEAGAYPLVVQSYQQGFAPSAHVGIANSGGPAVDETFWENVKDAGKYLLTENVGLPKNAWNNITKEFNAAYKKAFNKEPSPQAVENYDAMLVLADAIKRAKSTDGKAIIAALEKTKMLGGRGEYTFSTGHEPDWAYHQFMLAPVALIQYDKTGQSADDAPIVWPRNIANSKSLYEKPAK